MDDSTSAIGDRMGKRAFSIVYQYRAPCCRFPKRAKLELRLMGRPIYGDAPPSPMRVCRMGDPGAVRIRHVLGHELDESIDYFVAYSCLLLVDAYNHQ